MTEFFASVGASRAISLRLTVPSWGAWTADVQLAEDAEVDAVATLTVGNLSAVGFVQRGLGAAGAFAGSRSVRMVGGRGGWQRTTPKAGGFYTNPNGLKLGLLLGDLAALVGEDLEISKTDAARVVGTQFVRLEQTASLTLTGLVGRSWFVGLDGKTRITGWPETTIVSDFVATGPGYLPHLGAFEIATEDPASWLPGALFSSPPTLPVAQRISSVSFRMGREDRLRVEVFVS